MISGETVVSIVDAYTYQVKHVIKTQVSPTITLATLFVAMDYAITGYIYSDIQAINVFRNISDLFLSTISLCLFV